MALHIVWALPSLLPWRGHTPHCRTHWAPVPEGTFPISSMVHIANTSLTRPSNSQGGAIDPAGFTDSDGTIYVVYKIDGNSIGHGGNCNNGIAPFAPTPIMIQPMEADGVTPRGRPTKILDRSDADGPLVEAPSLVWSREGVYVLFFSSNCFAGPNYDTSYATASNIMGPYTKSGRPLLVTGSGNNLYSPGGTDVLADGKKIVFHADKGTSARTRQMYVGEITISGTTVTI